eukprot:gene1269-1385_t
MISVFLLQSHNMNWEKAFMGWSLTTSYGIMHVFMILFHLERVKDNEDFQEGFLFPPQVLIIFAPHVLYATSLCKKPIMFVWVWSIIFLGLILGSAIILHHVKTVKGLVYYLILSLLLIYGTKQRAMDEGVLQEAREMEAQRSRAEEMERQEDNLKHMIANVAHDLKTPLSSFMAGVDILGEIVAETSHQLERGVLDVLQVQEMLTTTQQCIRNIRNTNNFMLMTINRCIDYTKASKGVKLVPKYETFDLMETLSLPLNCMKDIQNHIAITLQPIPTTICPHILTDKQWLQENVLCLLSNAVKYSSGGHVVITVSLDTTIATTNTTNMPVASLPPIQEKEADGDSGRLSQVSLASSVASFILSSTTKVKIAPELIAEDNNTSYDLLDDRPLSTSTSMTTQEPSGSGSRDPSSSGGPSLIMSPRLARSSSFSALINRSASTEMGSEGRYILTRAQSADYNQPTTLPPPSRGNGSSGKRLHILLVDDTPSVMKMTSMLLRRQGFEVTSAENGAIALDLIQANLDQQINALQQQQQQQQQARNKKGMIKLLDSNGDGYGHSSSGGGCEQETEIEKEYSNKMMMLIRSSSTTTTTTTPTSSQLPCLSSYPTRESMSTTRTMRSNDDDTNTRKRSSKKETTTTVSSRSGGSGSIGGGLLSIISRSLTSDRTARYYEEGSSSSSVVMDLRDDLPDDNNNNTTTANTNTNTNNTTSLLHHVVIGVSANNDDETQSEMRACGFDSYLPKPFSMTLFYDMKTISGNEFSAEEQGESVSDSNLSRRKSEIDWTPRMEQAIVASTFEV